jgi:hypothetical protein
MRSPGIDKWVEKNPKSWSKLAKDLKEKETFTKFKKKLMAGAKEQGKQKQIENMTQAQLLKIYYASGVAIQNNLGGKQKTKEKQKKPKKIKVLRKGKTYTRTITQRYSQDLNLALKITAKQKPRSKEYYKYINILIGTTGRTRQAIIKKVQRIRQQNKNISL